MKRGRFLEEEKKIAICLYFFEYLLNRELREHFYEYLITKYYISISTYFNRMLYTKDENCNNASLI